MGQSKRINEAATDRRMQEAERLAEQESHQFKTKSKMNNSERLNSLYTTYGLTEDDYFKHKFYTIITRSGIDKIQAKASIDISYNLIYHTEDCKTVIIKAEGKTEDNRIETFGECNPGNNSNSYPIAMAEKRAMSRVVLKLAGFYELGAFGEDESEDFKRK